MIAFPNIKSTDDLAGAGGWQAFTDVFRSANNTWTLLTKPRAITTK